MGLWWLQQTGRGCTRGSSGHCQEAVNYQDAERWSEALSATRHAEGVLAGIGPEAGLRHQVRVLIEDLEMARRLQEAGLRKRTSS